MTRYHSQLGGGSSRIAGLDQARAIALVAMLWAHSCDALRERIALPLLHGPESILLQRFATPAFVTIFGLALGAVRWAPARTETSRRIRANLFKKSAILLACNVIFSMPNWIRSYIQGGSDPLDYLFGYYSILIFYALALAGLAAAGDWLRARSLWFCFALGVVLWLPQYGSSWLFSPRPRPDFLEWVQMVFVSGKYGWFGLMGWTLMMVPLGARLSRDWKSGHCVQVLRLFVLVGVLMSAAGAFLGLIMENRLPHAAGTTTGGLGQSLIALLAPEYTPRLWFYMTFGGMAVASTGLLGLANRIGPLVHRGLHPLSLFGRNSLVVYVSQSLVLPGVALLRWAQGSRGVWQELLPVSLFLAFGLVLMWRTERSDRRAEARRTASRGRPVEEGVEAVPTPVGRFVPSWSARLAGKEGVA